MKIPFSLGLVAALDIIVVLASRGILGFITVS